ncbi:DUF3558 domain-containing protein [Kibdelosporangium philippinense]|uniref:DUF3558 domain-containing protein n=1 Tax=Kibdelosporangium philippinense TaxID=211113 RepID=A0ABS8Z5N5_9PSEU|nr:DUF3558 family protein [Kibdelosporangium philippinense]MCE7003203.1 DUF3558 domain-containing protein [Kibdelosporangium philippinense]
MVDAARPVMPWLCTLVMLTVTACSTPDRPPEPAPTPTTPIPAPQLDVSRYLSDPCSGVPANLSSRLGLRSRKSSHSKIIINAGDQAECQLTTGPPLTAAAAVRFYPHARPLTLVFGPGSGIKPTTVAGYPAGEWIQSTGADGSFTSCQYIVDIAETQGFGTLYNGPSGEPIETSCAHAKELADSVIAAIPR